ncbi:hypothetical protein J6590_055477 [Homalodisca vitripennis]|nr:hypothetical protein J6590_055477 [Homalodisca vitripennis]
MGDDIRCVNVKKLILMTIFDFSKALDCVYHPLIFIKLKRVGVFLMIVVNWVKPSLLNASSV